MDLIDVINSESEEITEDSEYYFSAVTSIDTTSPSHGNYSMEIVICYEGVLNMVINGKEYELKKNQAVFIRPYELHSFITKQYNKSKIIVFSPSFVSDFFDFTKNNTYDSCCFEVSDDLLAYYARILSEERCVGNNIIIPAILWPLCFEIKNKLKFRPGKYDLEDTLSKALSYINQHFKENITLKSVAKAVGIHQVTLSRKLNDIVKKSFSDYLNMKRCTYAAQLMETGKVSCTTASIQAGFGSIRSFNRTFLNIFGVTPSEFKNNPNIIQFKLYH